MSPSTIYVLCPDYNVPSGGVQKLYRHVDVLNNYGFVATILHHQHGFRCTWFENATPIAYTTQALIGPSDYVVVPEIYGPHIAAVAPGVRKVVFNQNCYLTFRGHSPDTKPIQTPYHSPEVVAVLVVSEDNRQYLTYAFPHVWVLRLRYGIDTKLFAPPETKRRLIAFMPRKNSDHLLQVLMMLRLRDALADFELAPIDARGSREVAAILRESTLFLSFGFPEGFGLPPAEAMACGCIAIGYHGGGGKEYWKPEFTYPIEVGDITGFARTVEQVVRDYQANPPLIQAKAARAAAFIHETYSVEQEEQDIVAAWRSILNVPQSAPHWPS